MPVSRIVVNTLASIGAVSSTTNLDPSMTLGCGGYGENISSDNITARHLLNVKRIAYSTKNVEITKSDEMNNKTNNNLEKIADNVLNVNQNDDNSDVNYQKIGTFVKNVLKYYQKQ